MNPSEALLFLLLNICITLDFTQLIALADKDELWETLVGVTDIDDGSCSWIESKLYFLGSWLCRET